MSKLPRKWSTAIGVLFLFGMAATIIAPFVLSAGLMGEWRAKQMLDHTGILLTLVIAIHVVACVILAVVGFIAIKGRPVSVGVSLAVVAAPAMIGLILGRIEMSSAARHALSLAPAARPGEIAHALAYTASPLLGGILGSAALLFAFAWSVVLAHWALHKQGVGGKIGFFVAVSWLPPVGALLGWVIFAFNMHRWPRPPSYGNFVMVGVFLFAFGVTFALPASRGLKTFEDRASADAALSRLLNVVWAFPVSVAVLAFAHALNLLGSGLEQVQGSGGSGPVTGAEQEIANGHLWAAINIALALLSTLPLLIAGGAFRRLTGLRSWDRLVVIVVAVLALGALWFEQGRHALLALTRDTEASVDRFAAIDLPKGDGNAPVGSGPALRLDPQGNLKWDGGDGQLVSLDTARLDGLTSLRIAVPSSTPFSKLTPVLQQLAKGHPIIFRLVEQHTLTTFDGRELSALAKAFEPVRDGYVALAFRFSETARLESLAALSPEDPPRSAVIAGIDGDHCGMGDLATEGQLPGWDCGSAEGLAIARGRLDESPWVVISVRPGNSVQTVASLVNALSQHNSVELVLAPVRSE